MVSRRTRVASWIFRRDHPSRPNAMICCFFSSFKTFAMLREATYPPAAVNVLDVSSESMAAFQVFMYGRFWVFTEVLLTGRFKLLDRSVTLAGSCGGHYLNACGTSLARVKVFVCGTEKMLHIHAGCVCCYATSHPDLVGSLLLGVPFI